MRISTNTIYQTAISKIGDLQSDQSKLQQQIATGRRILTPSDDPLAASRALEISQSQNMNTQFTNNRKIAVGNLTGLDTSLGSINEILTTTQTTLVGAAGTLSTAQRGVVATQLSSTLETLIGLANTRDATGNYMYAGFKGDTKPFTATAAGATYNGDSNQQLLQVDGQRQMAVNATGDSVFQAGGNDVFATYSNLITVLNNPASTDAAVQSAVASAITSIKDANYNVGLVRSSVGSKLNEIDSLDAVGSSRDLEYAQSLSSLQDLDYTQALSDVAQKQTILDAAQKAFVKTTSLSLFDYIK